MGINLCWETRPGNLASRIHEFSEPAVTKESVTGMNFVRSREHSRAVGHSTIGRSELEHLFDFDLQAAPDKQPYISTRGREGSFITNSIGTLTGKIQGKIRMSFFAIDCAYLLVQAGRDPGPGQHLCKENDGGVIETDDGALIAFDTKGYGLRGADLSFPRRWRLAMAVQFSTTDKRYEWLNTAFGFWEGQFDEEKGAASYKGYVRRYD